MSNKQQTAVEWYDNEIGKLFDQFTMGKIKIYEFQNQRFKLEKQAKEKEREQHKVSYWESLMSKFQTFEHYWEQTYGGNK